jgi:hypothetical protein
MGVPDDYESYTEGDYKTLRQKVEMELAEDDIGAWEEMVKQKGFESQIFTGVTKPLEIPTVAYVVPASLESTATPEQVAASVVPVERTESMIMAGKIVKLKSIVNEEVARLNQHITNLKIMKTKADASADADMMVVFSKAISGCITRTSRLVTLVSKLLTEVVVDEKMPQLIDLLESCSEKYVYICNWAAKFDCQVETAKGVGRKRRYSSERV